MGNRGKLIVFSGPSGSGKGTVLNEVFKLDNTLKYSISATTRAPREGEIDGVDYFFKTREEFERMIEDGDFLEWAEYVGNYYGTPEKAVDKWLDMGYNVILEIEVNGALQVAEKRPDAVMLFIAPPSLEILEERLRKRGTEDEATILRRMEKATREMGLAPSYAYTIVNDGLDDAIAEFREVLARAK